MSTASKHLLNKTLFSYFGFVLFLVLGQWMGHQLSNTFWIYMSILTFNILLVGVWGIAVPIIVSRQFEFKLSESVHPFRLANGIILLLLILHQAFSRTGMLNAVFAEAANVLVFIKYILFLLPLAVGIMLHCFFLIPKTIERVSDPAASPIATRAGMVLVSGVSLGFVFFAFSLFSAPGTAFIMLLLGLVIAAATVLTGSIYYAFPVFYAVTLAHSFVEADYLFEPAWGPIFFGIFSAIAAFVILFRYYRDNVHEADSMRKSRGLTTADHPAMQ